MISRTVKPRAMIPGVKITRQKSGHVRLKIKTITRIRFRLIKVFCGLVLLPACLFAGMVLSFDTTRGGSKWYAVQHELSVYGEYGHRPKWERYLGAAMKTNGWEWLAWTIGLGFIATLPPYLYCYRLLIDIKPDSIRIGGKRYAMDQFGGFLIGEAWLMDSNHMLFEKLRERRNFTKLHINYGQHGQNLPTPYLMQTVNITSTVILLNELVKDVRKPPEQRRKEQTGRRERF